MKLSRSKPRWIAIASLTLVAALALPGVAFASLNDPASGTSLTNPNLPPEDWRQGWGNSRYPEFTWSDVPHSDTTTLPTLGFLYNVTRRQFASLPDTAAPRWDVTWDPSGTFVHHVLDMGGIFADIPVAERSYISTSGQITHDPLEGRWWFNKRWFNASEIGTGFTHYDFGLDFTPPRAVMGFTSGVRLPTEMTRRKFTWINQEYDDLSRGYWYELYVNDMTKPVRRFQIIPWMPGAATIEDLPPGINVVGIRVMDRAGNEGPMVTHVDLVDPDYPTLSLPFPAQGQWVRGICTFNAVASDAAGITNVTFALDGKARQSSLRQTLTVNTTALAAGRHTLSVSATDMFGHVRTVSHDFYVDNIAPTFSSISDSPDPWYPCLQDGYKDVATFRGYVNEFVTDLFCQLYDEDGTTVIAEGHMANGGPGRFSFTCNGRDKNTDAPMNIGPMGSYKILKWRFTAKDRAGNWRIMPMQTIEVRNYEIVNNPGGGVKVVPR